MGVLAACLIETATVACQRASKLSTLHPGFLESCEKSLVPATLVAPMQAARPEIALDALPRLGHVANATSCISLRSPLFRTESARALLRIPAVMLSLWCLPIFASESVTPAHDARGIMLKADASLGLSWGGGLSSPGAASSVRFSIASQDQLSIGLLGGLFRHGADDRVVDMLHGAVELEWRMDRAGIVPSLHAGIGGLVRSFGDEGAGRAVVHVAGAFDWWPTEPFSGLSVGAELRYLGAPSLSFSPTLSSLTFRIGRGW